jgi:uncharacterized membrane protein YesL
LLATGNGLWLFLYIAALNLQVGNAIGWIFALAMCFIAPALWFHTEVKEIVLALSAVLVSVTFVFGSTLGEVRRFHSPLSLSSKTEYVKYAGLYALWRLSVTRLCISVPFVRACVGELLTIM